MVGMAPSMAGVVPSVPSPYLVYLGLSGLHTHLQRHIRVRTLILCGGGTEGDVEALGRVCQPGTPVQPPAPRPGCGARAAQPTGLGARSLRPHRTPPGPPAAPDTTPARPSRCCHPSTGPLPPTLAPTQTAPECVP